MNQLEMIDVSSHNTIRDLRRVWDAGVRVLAIKATEGTTYAWDAHDALTYTWHGFGGFVNHYHFMHPGSTPEAFAEAEWFVHHVKAKLGSHDLVTVDAETHGENNVEVGAFIDRVVQHFPVIRGLEYSYAAFLNESHIGPHDHWGLWVAGYGSSSAPSVPAWHGGYTAWQFTDAASVPGITGNVDVSHLQRSVIEPTLRRGESNFAVLNAKQALWKAGERMFTMNGDYGWGTARAVAAFKRKHKIPGDGSTIGPRVWSALHHFM